ncbi:hypothetical protein [Arcicella sp. BE51]|nr:hypothetical protein [Arcicella sp. BE51]
MYSISQIASAYHIKQVRYFKIHVKNSGLGEVLPKLLENHTTIYRKELLIIMEYLGATPKMLKIYDLPL